MSMASTDFDRMIDAPPAPMWLDELLHRYAWHARHHLAHITNAVGQARHSA